MARLMEVKNKQTKDRKTLMGTLITGRQIGGSRLIDRLYYHYCSWSFGICLWEIFTLGGTPYPGIPTDQLLDFLSDGHRMEQPQNCPLEIYTIMRDCWLKEPDQRPTFTHFSERIGRILELRASEVGLHCFFHFILFCCIVLPSPPGL